MRAIVNDLPETRDSLLLGIRDPANGLAWEQFVEIYRPVIYRAASARGLQHADAQDLVQTVLISVAGAIQRWEKTGPATKFRHWLLRVTRNATINAIQRRPAMGGLGTSVTANLLDVSPTQDADCEQLLDIEYRKQLFLRAAEIVRVDVRLETWKAFELTAIDGMTNEQAARELGKSLGTIYAARSRIMKRLIAIVSELESTYQ